jgi:hypothetical protein
MGLVDTLPISRVRPVLFLAPWLGTLRDESGNSNHATPVAPIRWVEGERDALLTNGAGYISIGASSSIAGMTASTILFAGRILQQTTSDYIVRSMTGATVYWYLIAGNVVLYDGTSFSLCPCDVIGARSLAVTIPGTTGKPEFFTDGVSDGFGGLDVSVTWPSSEIRLFGVSGINGLESPATALAIYPDVLTAAEIADWHDYTIDLLTPRKQWPAQGLDYAGVTFTGEPTYVDNIQSARVSLADETAGRLSNTGLSILLGTWRVVEDSSGRKISCVADGKLRRKLTGADTYATARFDSTGGVVLTKAAGYIELTATAGDTISALVLTAP